MKVSKSFELFCKEGDTVFDVGAHVGKTALLMSSLVGPSGRVFSFEAQPEKFLQLSLNIAASKSENIIPIFRAISNTNGSCSIFSGSDGRSDQASTILPELATHERFGANITNWKVESETLVSFCERQGLVPSFMKVDVEGAENLVFEGASSLYIKNRAAFYFECGYSGTLQNLEHLLYLPGLNYILVCADVLYHHEKWINMEYDQLASIATILSPGLLEQFAKGAVMNIIACPVEMWAQVSAQMQLLTEDAFVSLLDTLAGLA